MPTAKTPASPATPEPTPDATRAATGDAGPETGPEAGPDRAPVARPEGPPGATPAQSRVIRSMRTFGNEIELYIGAAGRENEMHRTDLTGLAVVMDARHGDQPVTPGRLSAALQLSAPATSAMLDRLERLGHVQRVPHATDRRSVVVELTDHALEVGGRMFGRLGQFLGPVIEDYTDDQLDLIATFLDRTAEATSAARENIPK